MFCRSFQSLRTDVTRKETDHVMRGGFVIPMLRWQKISDGVMSLHFTYQYERSEPVCAIVFRSIGRPIVVNCHCGESFRELLTPLWSWIVILEGCALRRILRSYLLLRPFSRTSKSMRRARPLTNELVHVSTSFRTYALASLFSVVVGWRVTFHYCTHHWEAVDNNLMCSWTSSLV